MSPPPRDRGCAVLRGTPRATREAAGVVVAPLHADDVLWVGSGGASPADVRQLLGSSFDAVVLDLHEGLDPDLLGRVHGLVRGGGRLVLRMPPASQPPPGAPRLAVLPHRADDVGRRMWQRLERALRDHPAVVPPRPVFPPPRPSGGTQEQAAAVRRLTESWTGPGPSRTVLTADRGRGKSSALGLALAALRAEQPDRSVVVTADSEASVQQVVHHGGPLEVHQPTALLTRRDPVDVLVVDEAARLPVPLLQRLVERYPDAHVALSTTTRGYEGTGRGFVLRFLRWLDAQPVPVDRITLRHPIRWGPDDPLEDLVFRVLALDATPAALPAALDPDRLSTAAVDRDALARDESLLRELFGLLVHAHYRTTPADLHRLLDAPNVRVHAMRHEGHVVAATLLAVEGWLPPEVCDDLHAGRRRIRGHALPDTLISHLGRVDAGAMRMVRSVRIATHPAARRLGLASRLVDHVHTSYAPDLFGTLFGATPDLLSFRRSVGYTLVRVGVSRGVRTGEPAAVMVRAASPRAVPVVTALRSRLARDLPLQLQLLDGDDPMGLDDALRHRLLHDLPPAAPWTEVDRREAVETYVRGPRPYDASAGAVARSLGAERDALAALDEPDRTLVLDRVVYRRPWVDLAHSRGWTVPQAMRALRRVLATLLAGEM